MLTKKQKELFVYLNNYISSNDISPSFEEMKNAVNLKSKSGIHRLITSLEQRGYIKRLKHKARAMEITKNLPNKNVNNIESSNDESFLNIPLVGSIAAGEAIEAINSIRLNDIYTQISCKQKLYIFWFKSKRFVYD